MANPKVAKRIAIGQARLMNVLATHGIASSRTLEQKISDAGPADLRIDPAHLKRACNLLIKRERVIMKPIGNTPWFHRYDTSDSEVEERLEAQLPVHEETTDGTTTKLIGQALEIAVYKSLVSQDSLNHFGGFENLDSKTDDTLYSKEEPPNRINGRSFSGELDFIVSGPSYGAAGIEVKNVRQWIYPNNQLVHDLLAKCCSADLVPVLIARRIAYVARAEIFEPCGIIIHETYNQLYPESRRDLAERAKHKRLLGYHDIRVGNDPDKRLSNFIHVNLPRLLPEARKKFDIFKDLLADFANRRLEYREFWRAVRSRRGKPVFIEEEVENDSEEPPED